MTCPHCKTKNPADYVLCWSCARSLSPDATLTSPTDEPSTPGRILFRVSAIASLAGLLVLVMLALQFALHR